MKIHIERKFTIIHYLPKNNETYQDMHEHDWKAVVDIEGEIDEQTEMLVDFVKIKTVIDSYDHKLLNTILENPTLENIVYDIAVKIRQLRRNITVTVKVYESKNAYAEVTEYAY